MRWSAVPVICGLLTGAARAAPPDLDRGRYLVERVGLCGDCHSPRDAAGAPIPARALTGAPIGFAPTHPMPAWADHAPPLAGGTPGYDATALARFMQTGARPDGSRARPPMPPYRLSAADSEALVAYLATLPK